MNFYARFDFDPINSFEDTVDAIHFALDTVFRGSGTLVQYDRSSEDATYRYTTPYGDSLKIYISNPHSFGLSVLSRNSLGIDAVLGIVFTLEDIGCCEMLEVGGFNTYFRTYDISPESMSACLRVSEDEYAKMWEEVVLPILEEYDNDA